MRIRFKCRAETVHCMLEINGIEYIGNAHFITPETGSYIETLCGSQHDDLPMQLEITEKINAEIFCVFHG